MDFPRLPGDEGTTTAEYAIGTVAAAAFALALLVLLRGDAIASALSGLVQRALTVAN
ncbi:DUF4244 domain-containing protein [Amycolatopsis sp. FDAARGOS 1241]|uniref:DUF4244 domain-containing protein n=1 Tax=Amycolatopsis sp. FDAARGOS 1241 TaxID=2778070 RepID=UPI00194EE1A5|nr:DUF4244 domain-containing protein [Amycolatopsis sp. FDAARGOS 1241]QRP46567.1 DUF4244 domain-containing protein [Amycolatopsis sp. FDAARGOS 1241]